jgi:hypothetical protein
LVQVEGQDGDAPPLGLTGDEQRPALGLDQGPAPGRRLQSLRPAHPHRVEFDVAQQGVLGCQPGQASIGHHPGHFKQSGRGGRGDKEQISLRQGRTFRNNLGHIGAVKDDHIEAGIGQGLVRGRSLQGETRQQSQSTLQKEIARPDDKKPQRGRVTHHPGRIIDSQHVLVAGLEPGSDLLGV